MRILILFLFALVAGCSSTSDNAAGDLPSRDQAARVVVIDTVPDETGRFSNLSATLCRGGGPMAPSRANALLLLKMRAYQNGYLLLHSVTVGPVTGPLADHCSGGIQAKGVGFSRP